MHNLSCSLCGGGGCESNTVPAGEVAVSLAVCGYRTELARLPIVRIEEQRYSSGMCPACALEKGTLFPELVSRY